MRLWPLLERAGGWNARTARARMGRRSPTAAPLRIPFGKEELPDYLARLDRVVASPRGRLYIDTSFLVWLTALSVEARSEFKDWLAARAAGRVHVPVWAAHEFFRHHSQKLHERTLSAITGELNGLANRTLRDLRPYLDSPIADDARTPEAIASAVRASLVDVKRIAVAASRWHGEHYATNAADVIGMINDWGLASPELLGWMENIEAVEKARFEGRIPPGFQDRGKKGAKATAPAKEDPAAPGSGGRDGTPGSNSFGDLVFWKEILEHARAVHAEGVVILTNDRKNDWKMPGAPQPHLDEELREVRSSLPPVPQPHPMLLYEAANVAGVSEVLLVDDTYVAIHLRRAGRRSNRLFGIAVDVAVPTPAEADEKERKEKAREAIKASGRDRGPAAVAARHLPVDDGPGVSDAALALRLALDGSGGAGTADMHAVLEAMTGQDAEPRPLAEILTKELLAKATTPGLAWLARSLGTRSIAGDPMAIAYATDLLTVVDRLPPRTATALYLGLLAAAYLELEEEGGGVLAVPRGPWLTSLFRTQDSPRARPAIEAFTKRLPALGGRPIYLPDPDRPTLPVSATFAAGTSRLTALSIAGMGVVSQTTGDHSRRIATLLGRDGAPLGEVARVACELLGIPVEQLERSDALSRDVHLSPTLGIAEPADLRNDMEDEL